MFLFLQRNHPEVAIKASTTTPATQSKVSPFVTTAPWREGDPRQQELTKLVVNYIARGLQPLSTVEDPDFRALMKKAAPSYTLPSRKHLSTKLLPNRTEELKEIITDRLRDVLDICLTVDIWSSRDMRSYIGVTGHFVEKFSLQSVMLACQRFKGSHTGEHISSTVQQIITSFDLNNKISIIITDNAANMLRAFVTLPGLEKDNPSDSDSEDDDDGLQTADTSAVMDSLPDHIPCFAHTLQLVVKDGLKHTAGMTSVINKASKLVTHVRHSSLGTELFEGDTKFQARNDTRWSSVNKMLKSVLQADPIKMEKLNYPGKLTKSELKIIAEITEALSPFQLATDQCQGQNVVTASLVLPCIRGLRAELADLSTTYKSKFVSTLASSIDSRLGVYEHMESFQLAAVLDPRWKVDWCTPEEVKDLTDLLSDKVSALLPKPETNVTSSPPKKKCKLFRFMSSTSSKSSSSSSAQAQVDNYLAETPAAEDTDPLMYWKSNKPSYPELTTLALRYLAIPASSAPVERLFSIAGKVFRPDRCLLSDIRFEQLMFLRCNSDMDN